MKKFLNLVVSTIIAVASIDIGITSDMEKKHVLFRTVPHNTQRYMKELSKTKEPLPNTDKPAEDTSELPTLTPFPFIMGGKKTGSNSETLFNSATFSQKIQSPFLLNQANTTIDTQGAIKNNDDILNKQKDITQHKLSFGRIDDFVKSAFSPFRATEKELISDTSRKTSEIKTIINDFQLNTENNINDARTIEILIPKELQNDELNDELDTGKIFLRKKHSKKNTRRGSVKHYKLSKANTKELYNTQYRIIYRLDRLVKSNNDMLLKLDEIKNFCQDVLNKMSETNFQKRKENIQIEGQLINLQSLQFGQSSNEMLDNFDNLPSNEARLTYLFEKQLNNNSATEKYLLKISKFVLYYNDKHKEKQSTVWETVQYIGQLFKSKPLLLFDFGEKKNVSIVKNSQFNNFWTVILFLNILSKNEIVYRECNGQIKIIDVNNICHNGFNSKTLLMLKLNRDLIKDVDGILFLIKKHIDENNNSTTLNGNINFPNKSEYLKTLNEVKQFVCFSHVLCNDEFVSSIPMNAFFNEYIPLKTVRELFIYKFLPTLHKYFKLTKDVVTVVENELKIRVPNEFLNYESDNKASA